MERIHVSVYSIVLFYTHLQAFLSCCKTQPYFDAGSNDTIAIVGQTLTLSCNFSEPVGANYTVTWKNATDFIGRCHLDDGCYKFSPFDNDPRINLSHIERKTFQLDIDDIRTLDSGLYECGLEENSYVALHTLVVSVVQSLTTKTNPITTPPISPRTMNKVTPRHILHSTLPRTEGSIQTNTKQDKVDTSTVYKSMLYYCLVASTTALLIALIALWRTNRRNLHKSEFRGQKSGSPTDDQTFSPCNRAYEEIEPSCSELQENALYHNHIEETSLDLIQPRSSTSCQGNTFDMYDMSISRDVKPDIQLDDQCDNYQNLLFTTNTM